MEVSRQSFQRKNLKIRENKDISYHSMIQTNSKQQVKTFYTYSFQIQSTCQQVLQDNLETQTMTYKNIWQQIGLDCYKHYALIIE